MNMQIITQNGAIVALITGNAKIITDTQSALDLIMTVKYEAGTLNFTPSCPLELLKEQKKYMGNYIRTLKIRAEIEKIDLN